MNINCKSIVIMPNKDCTHRVKLIGCKFKDINGKETECVMIIPKLPENVMLSLKKDNVLSQTEEISVCINE